MREVIKRFLTKTSLQIFFAITIVVVRRPLWGTEGDPFFPQRGRRETVREPKKLLSLLPSDKAVFSSIGNFAGGCTFGEPKNSPLIKHHQKVTLLKTECATLSENSNTRKNNILKKDQKNL